MKGLLGIAFAICFSFSTALANNYEDFLSKVEVYDFNDPVAYEQVADWFLIPSKQIVAPIADYEPISMVFTSASTPYDGLFLKKALAENLPEEVDLVVYGPKRELKDTADTISRSAGNVKYVKMEDMYNRDEGYEEWTRDHIPQPVWIKGQKGKRLGLVSSQYRWGYDVNHEFSRLLLSPIFYEIQDFIEFGNLIINSKNKTAYVIQSARLRDVPSEVFLSLGVTRVVRLPHLERMDKDGKPYLLSIGHADERMTFLSEGVVAVDTPEYAKFFESEGFKVVMLPIWEGKEYQYRSYTNTLLVNYYDKNKTLQKMAFVPSFLFQAGTPDKAGLKLASEMDEKAFKVYREAGYTVVPVPAPMTADVGRGNIHCQTKTLPVRPDGEPWQLLDWSFDGPM